MQDRITIFRNIGFNPSESKILDFLFKQGTSTPVSSRQIDIGADLRQPEVSKTIRRFVERKWVSETEIPSKRGRPNKMYQFRLSRKDFISIVEKQVQDKLKEQEKAIQQLRDMA